MFVFLTFPAADVEIRRPGGYYTGKEAPPWHDLPARVKNITDY
jgi:hypothetical protein